MDVVMKRDEYVKMKKKKKNKTLENLYAILFSWHQHTLQRNSWFTLEYLVGFGAREFYFI